MRSREVDAVARQPERRLHQPLPWQQVRARQSAASPAGSPGHAARSRTDRVVNELRAERDVEVQQLRVARFGTRARARRRSSRDCEPDRSQPRSRSAWPPPSSPVMTVSATHDASDAATAASAALPPSSNTSIPAAAVAGWPPLSPPASHEKVSRPRPFGPVVCRDGGCSGTAAAGARPRTGQALR